MNTGCSPLSSAPLVFGRRVEAVVERHDAPRDAARRTPGAPAAARSPPRGAPGSGCARWRSARCSSSGCCACSGASRSARKPSANTRADGDAHRARRCVPAALALLGERARRHFHLRGFGQRGRAGGIEVKPSALAREQRPAERRLEAGEAPRHGGVRHLQRRARWRPACRDAPAR